MLTSFRIFSVIEGLSLLILLFIAMPLKYYANNYEIVPLVGWIHGILWTIYFGFALLVSHFKGWSIQMWLFALLTSVIPFGFIPLERLLARKYAAPPATA